MQMRRALSIWIPVNRQLTVTVSTKRAERTHGGISFFWQKFSETTSIDRRFSGGILGAANLKPSGRSLARIRIVNPMVQGNGFFSGISRPSLDIDHSVDFIFNSGCVLRDLAMKIHQTT